MGAVCSEGVEDSLSDGSGGSPEARESAACYVGVRAARRSPAAVVEGPIAAEVVPIDFAVDPIAGLEAGTAVEGIARRYIGGLEHRCTAAAGLDSLEEGLDPGSLAGYSTPSAGKCTSVRIL